MVQRRRGCSDDKRVHVRHAGDDRGARVLPVVLHREAWPPTELPEGALEPDFVSGKIGAFISGPWHIGLLKEQGGAGFDDKFAVAPMPMKKSATSFIGGSNLAVFKDAKNRDAGWKFVQWLSKPEVQVKWYQAVKDLPAVQSAWDDSTLSGDPYLAVFGEQLEDAKAPPAIPTWEQIAAAFDTEVEKLCKSGVDPAATAKTIQEKADRHRHREPDMTGAPVATAPARPVGVELRPAGRVDPAARSVCAGR